MATLSAVFLSTAAFAQSASEKVGVNSALGIAPGTSSTRPRLATCWRLIPPSSQQKGNAAEKTFANQMIADHSKASCELKSLVSGDMKAASRLL
jgi:putative membrane protein